MNFQDYFVQIPEKQGELTVNLSLQSDVKEEKCPICDSELIRNGRCKTCYACGWSSCDL